MENQISVNRVEREVGQWHTREERLGKLFSFSLSSNRALAKEKLECYDCIAAKYRGTRDIDERFALKALAQERRRIEKQLYPNLLVRLVRWLVVMPLLQRLAISRYAKQVKQNSQSLHDKVQRAGFTDISLKIDHHIRQGEQQFSIPVSYYVNEKERLDHQLFFAKDQSGQYNFNGYKASLHNESKPGENRQQHFNMDAGYRIDKSEAYNLLDGRCIHKNGDWLQLDLNDKDPQGNHRIKEFHSGYGYDLEKILKGLPLKELSSTADTEKLLNSLKHGSRQSVSFIKDGNEQRYYIESNPQFKSVTIYDEHSKKISLVRAVGNKTIGAVKLSHKINDEPSQSKRSKMKISK